MRKSGSLKKSMLALCVFSFLLLIAGFAVVLILSPSAPPEQAALEAAMKFAHGPVGLLRDSATASNNSAWRVSDGKTVWLVQLRKSGRAWEAISVVEIGALEQG